MSAVAENPVRQHFYEGMFLVDSGKFAEQRDISKSENGLLILLDSDYREIGRTWAEIGVDSFFNTVNVNQGQIIIGGKAGSKGFIGELQVNDGKKTNHLD